jgi:hypothetical protein
MLIPKGVVAKAWLDDPPSIGCCRRLGRGKLACNVFVTILRTEALRQRRQILMRGGRHRGRRNMAPRPAAGSWFASNSHETCPNTRLP